MIVKPSDSAGSDDVTLCLSCDDVKNAFTHIMANKAVGSNGLGLVNKAVLVQEYLEGTEYVVDMVSLNGHHKVVAVRENDKGSCDGAKFVMFGMRPQSPSDENISEIVAYQKQVITALGVQNGPTHGVVKWTNGSPCLVDVGARCHGGEGMWTPVANSLYGYNQVEVTAAAYLDTTLYASYPDEPSTSTGRWWMRTMPASGRWRTRGYSWWSSSRQQADSEEAKEGGVSLVECCL